MARKPDHELTPAQLARREYHRRYRAANAEKLAAQQRANYLRKRSERLAKCKVYYLKNAPAYRARAKVYRRENAEELKAYWRARKTGCTQEQYDRLLIAQGGACAICHGKDDRALSADHDHATGAVRGLLCTNCNVGLGNFQDNEDFLARATKYLQEARSSAKAA